MGDEAGGSGGLVPVTDEQAKALQEAFKLGQGSLETARAVGSYLAQILGTLPQDLVGILGGDWIRARRVENIINLAERARARLSVRQIEEPQPVPLSVGIPLLGYAADESREELVDLWARLLAAAMDPTRSRKVRQTFIDVVKSLDPMDALVLVQVRGLAAPMPEDVVGFLATKLQVRKSEIAVSLMRLFELKVIRDSRTPANDTPFEVTKPQLTNFGQELLVILND